MLEWTLTSALFAAIVGGVVGFLSGLFGVGGGFLLVPVLNAILGVPMAVAVGSTACYTIGPATVAMLTRKPKAGFLELPLTLSGGLFAGVWSGTKAVTALSLATSVTVLGRSLPALDLMVLLAYGALMSVIAATSLIDSARVSTNNSVRRRGLFTAIRLRPMAVIPDLRPAVYSIPLLAWMGYMIGFLSGFLGMSGGLILIPAAIYLLGLRVHDATTITIVIVWFVSIQSTFMHAMNGNVQRSLVVALLICGTIGAAFGSHVAIKLRSSQLKLGFGLLVLVSALIVFVKLWLLWSNSEETAFAVPLAPNQVSAV